MPPDTSIYMIAGILVILGGAMIYIATLVVRNQRVDKALRLLDETD